MINLKNNSEFAGSDGGSVYLEKCQFILDFGLAW